MRVDSGNRTERVLEKAQNDASQKSEKAQGAMQNVGTSVVQSGTGMMSGGAGGATAAATPPASSTASSTPITGA